MFRDVLIGTTPPMMFRDPFYVTIAAIVSLLTFLLAIVMQMEKYPLKISSFSLNILQTGMLHSDN